MSFSDVRLQGVNNREESFFDRLSTPAAAVPRLGSLNGLRLMFPYEKCRRELQRNGQLTALAAVSAAAKPLPKARRNKELDNLVQNDRFWEVLPPPKRAAAVAATHLIAVNNDEESREDSSPPADILMAMRADSPVQKRSPKVQNEKSNKHTGKRRAEEAERKETDEAVPTPPKRVKREKQGRIKRVFSVKEIMNIIPIELVNQSSGVRKTVHLVGCIQLSVSMKKANPIALMSGRTYSIIDPSNTSFTEVAVNLFNGIHELKVEATQRVSRFVLPVLEKGALELEGFSSKDIRRHIDFTLTDSTGARWQSTPDFNIMKQLSPEGQEIWNKINGDKFSVFSAKNIQFILQMLKGDPNSLHLLTRNNSSYVATTTERSVQRFPKALGGNL